MKWNLTHSYRRVKSNKKLYNNVTINLREGSRLITVSIIMVLGSLFYINRDVIDCYVFFNQLIMSFIQGYDDNSSARS